MCRGCHRHHNRLRSRTAQRKHARRHRTCGACWPAAATQRYAGREPTRRRDGNRIGRRLSGANSCARRTRSHRKILAAACERHALRTVTRVVRDFQRAGSCPAGRRFEEHADRASGADGNRVAAIAENSKVRRARSRASNVQSGISGVCYRYGLWKAAGSNVLRRERDSRRRQTDGRRRGRSRRVARQWYR
jgi:hypothetical protein